MKKILFIIIFIIFLISGIGIYWNYLAEQEKISKITNFEECAAASYPIMESYPRQCRAGNKTFAEYIGNELEKTNLICITAPRPNGTIKSPAIIEGEARGYWFFEASFPIKLYDENNKLLATAVAQAQSDWMTEDFVKFKAVLSYSVAQAGKGTLVLEKDNPSGLPENDDKLIVPVKYDVGVEAITVKAYFNNSKMDPEFSCNKVFPVERVVPKTLAVGRAALEELLKGVSDLEKDAGFFTSINSGVKIQSLTIENGVAKVDFNEQLEFQVGGSCRVSAIRAEITETLKQFPTVSSVVISINGRTEDILQP